jgi:hypothetical protein
MRHGPARRADDAGAGGQLALLISVEERRQQFALRQVTRRPENDEIKIIHRDNARGHAFTLNSFEVRTSKWRAFLDFPESAGNKSFRMIYTR